MRLPIPPGVARQMDPRNAPYVIPEAPETPWPYSGVSPQPVDNRPEPAVRETLINRGRAYGEYKSHAQVTQELKRVMRSFHGNLGNQELTDSQWEALDMVMHKVGRILNGNPNYIDSWRDIAGYADLVVQELQQTKGAIDVDPVQRVVGAK
jgi:Domain of unknown function (DUF6378)